MADELDELIGFLSDRNPQVRGAAVDIVRGLTGGEDGLRALTARADRALPALLRLLASAGGSGAGEAAADSLVNLSHGRRGQARRGAAGPRAQPRHAARQPHPRRVWRRRASPGPLSHSISTEGGTT